MQRGLSIGLELFACSLQLDWPLTERVGDRAWLFGQYE